MRYRNYFGDLVKFLIGGGLNTLFTYCLYFGLQLMINYQVAYAVAFIAGILFSYWFNSAIVFKVAYSLRSFFSFPALYFFQYFISALLLNFLVEQINIPQSLAPLVVIGAMFPITFILTRWILRRT